MGDTSSVAWLLRGTPSKPTQPGWGGCFVPAWDRPSATFHRMTTPDDQIEVFGILELILPLGGNVPDSPTGQLVVENQTLSGFAPGDGTLRFRFCPKAKKTYRFAIRSDDPTLDGKSGGISAVAPDISPNERKYGRYPRWWTDNPVPELTIGEHDGAKTVSRWRMDFLQDFAARMDRCPQRK